MALVGERIRPESSNATGSQIPGRGALLLAAVLLAAVGYAGVSHALTTRRPMHLGAYVLLGPRYDYSSTLLIHFGNARPGITGDWVEDNATWDGTRCRVSGKPVLMNAAGFMLLHR